MGLIRFLLAVSVLMSHAGGFAGYAIAGGDIAVQTFFIISGFLIQLVLSRRYDPKTDQWLFITNRILRIYPLYFICLIVTLLLALLVSGLGSGYFGFLLKRMDDLSGLDIAWLALTSIFIFGQETFLFLVQGNGGLRFGGQIDPAVWPLQPVPQAWSLSLELTFYLLAPWFARLSNRHLWTLFAASVLLKVALIACGLDYDPWTDRFFPTAVSMFLFGMLSYRYRARIKWTSRGRLLLSGAFVAMSLVMSMRFFAAMRSGVPIQAFEVAYFALAFFAIPSLFDLSGTLRGTLSGKLDSVMADLSYPIYVSHWFVLKSIEQLYPYVQGFEKLVRSATFVIVTIVVSMILVKLVEKPMDKIRTRRRMDIKI